MEMANFQPRTAPPGGIQAFRPHYSGTDGMSEVEDWLQTHFDPQTYTTGWQPNRVDVGFTDGTGASLSGGNYVFIDEDGRLRSVPPDIFELLYKPQV